MGGVFAAIGRFFSDLLAKFAAVVEWIGRAFVQVFVDLWEFATDLPVLFFDAVLGIAVTAVSALDFEVPDLDAGFGDLPAEMLNVLGLLGLGYALGIVGTALLIRLGLQLIPFVRLGS